jgi:NTP pyrophosphatase (non-canonical NTP hydrolase)
MNKNNLSESDYISFLEKSNHNLIKQIENNKNYFNEYYNFHKKINYEKNFDIKYLLIALSGEIGEVANEFKKIERDDNNIISDSRKNNIILELGDVMWYYICICNKLNIPIEHILNKHIQKLKSYDDVQNLC